jgi:hypothetical protein
MAPRTENLVSCTASAWDPGYMASAIAWLFSLQYGCHCSLLEVHEGTHVMLNVVNDHVVSSRHQQLQHVSCMADC